MAADVTQHMSSNIKCYASTFSNIRHGKTGQNFLTQPDWPATRLPVQTCDLIDLTRPARFAMSTNVEQIEIEVQFL